MVPLVRDWVAKNQHIDIKIMMVYLTTAIMEFGLDFFNKPVI
jgi:hypothetical protein